MLNSHSLSVAVIVVDIGRPSILALLITSPCCAEELFVVVVVDTITHPRRPQHQREGIIILQQQHDQDHHQYDEYERLHHRRFLIEFLFALISRAQVVHRFCKFIR